MHHQWNTTIDKLMQWRANNWIKYELKSATLYLRIHYNQLMIVSDTRVLESLNMNNRIKGIYKDDVLILIICCTGQEIRKLKFKIKANVSQCLLKLGEHFPVMSHNSMQSKNNLKMTYRNMHEVLRHALENKETSGAAMPSLPSNFVDFIKLCILDPNFLQTVRETERVLQELKIIHK